MREDIGFKNYTGIIRMLVMFAACGGVGAWMVCLRSSDFSLVFGVVFIAIAVFCGAAALVWMLRPRVLVQMDGENVYLWQRGGTVTVPLRKISGISASEAYRSLSRSGVITISLEGGAQVSVTCLKDSVGVRVCIERAAEAARGAAQK